MKDIFSEIVKLYQSQEEFAIATVLNTWRSAPRPIGSSMVITKSGEMIGSVSGGCIEKSVVQKALKIIEDGIPEELQFGVSNEDAWEVGLSCGGAISIHVDKFLGERKNQLWNHLYSGIEQNRTTTLINHLDERDYSILTEYDEFHGFLEDSDDADLKVKIKEVATIGKSEILESENGRVFVHCFPKKPIMILIGSAHITGELLLLAHLHNFEKVVIDPRDTFANHTNRPQDPDQMHVKWPQEVLPDLKLSRNCFAVILSHDPKIDDEALDILLKKDVAYVGALGSKKTHAKRIERLKERGFSDEELSKIHAPIGLDLGALLPREIALSVMAEVIKVKNSL